MKSRESNGTAKAGAQTATGATGATGRTGLSVTETPRTTKRLGGKVRALRRRDGLSQAALATRLGISASYLNLIENDRRPLPAGLLLELAQTFGVELATFATDDDARLQADLLEAFADSMFDSYELGAVDVRELVERSPALARSTLVLYQQFQQARSSAETLAQKLDGQEGHAVDRSTLPSEEVSDLLQHAMNYFPTLELGAEQLWKDAKLDADDLYPGLVGHLSRRHHVDVKIARWGDEPGTLRRFDPVRRVLTLSELLPTRSRNFQLASQICLLEQRDALDLITADPSLTTDESRALSRVALANYFAGAVLMPYEPFLQACREERYDADVIGRRFRVGFEQVCHRYTTMRRPGNEGVPFHMIRIDVAGNISKRFSGSGIRFARFSGACPRWNIFAAFLTPGLIRLQLSRMPDGHAFFCLARTIQKDSGGYHAQHLVHAIGLGCRVEYAKELVYSDGVDLRNLDLAVPVGVTCRVCERADCEQRAFPSVRHPLRIDPHVRGVSLYSPKP
jgi:predicted transcriptional regulator/DNA-binding XRE family transcriptional regulator